MQAVYLTTIDRPTTISDSAFGLIEELVAYNKVCQRYENPYTEIGPKSQEIPACIVFLEKDQQKQLSFIGKSTATDDEQQFGFIGPKQPGS